MKNNLQITDIALLFCSVFLLHPTQSTTTELNGVPRLQRFKRSATLYQIEGMMADQRQHFSDELKEFQTKLESQFDQLAASQLNLYSGANQNAEIIETKLDIKLDTVRDKIGNDVKAQLDTVRAQIINEIKSVVTILDTNIRAHIGNEVQSVVARIELVNSDVNLTLETSSTQLNQKLETFLAEVRQNNIRTDNQRRETLNALTLSNLKHSTIESVRSISLNKSDESQSNRSTANVLQQQITKLESTILRDRIENILKDLEKTEKNDKKTQSYVRSAELIWKQAMEHEELVKDFLSLPETICSNLNGLQEYNRSLTFVSDIKSKIETVLGPEHEEVLKLGICEANARKHANILNNCLSMIDLKDYEKVLGFVQESSDSLRNVQEFQDMYSLRIRLCKAGVKYALNITATDGISESELETTLYFWKLALIHDELVKDFGKLPLQICSKLIELREYNKSLVFVEESILRFETVFGVNHENTLRLKICKATNGKFNRGKELLQYLLVVAKIMFGNTHELTRDIQTQLEKLYIDCCAIQAAGNTNSGIYSIYPYESSREVKVYCDLTTGGGGWTVFQRREEVMGPVVDFYRDWASYESGFGNLNYSFWLGLQHISILTQAKSQSLRLEVTDWEYESAYDNYENFKVSNSSDSYLLTLDGYSGTAGDSMTRNNLQKFSTKDRDNDNWSRGDCGKDRKGGWWHKECTDVNANGIYRVQEQHITKDYNGVFCYTFKSSWYYSLKRIELKIRPLEFPNGCRK